MTSKEDHYLQSGVDVKRGDDLVSWLQSRAKPFCHPSGLGHVIDGIGGFAGQFSLPLNKFKNPTLVASTDGVGTKLLLGLESNKVDNLGQDLVAMCVNDLYTVGATPLFFLDYYATGRLESSQFKRILSSIKTSCQVCGMALLGGETAEMPGLYSKGHFDLAGFVVGIVDEDRRLGPHRTKVGDTLIAFSSSGFHANGFSLIRHWLKDKARPDLLDNLLRPTKIYNAIPELISRHFDSFHALAHITGGGISGNLPRVLGHGLRAEIKFDALPTESWMRDFIKSNGTNERDVEHIFNLGVGMIAVVATERSELFLKDSRELGLQGAVIGKLVTGESSADVLFV